MSERYSENGMKPGGVVGMGSAPNSETDHKVYNVRVIV